MKRIDELVLPALAEFGLSEEYNRRCAQHRVERQEDGNRSDDGQQDLGADVDVHSNDAGIDSNKKRALGEGEGAGHLLAPKTSSGQDHAEGKKDNAEGQEVHGGLSGFGFGGQQLGRHTLLLAHQGGNHAVTETPRENVGPLLNRLVGDANGVCCGSGGTAENFDGF